MHTNLSKSQMTGIIQIVVFKVIFSSGVSLSICSNKKGNKKDITNSNNNKIKTLLRGDNSLRNMQFLRTF